MMTEPSPGGGYDMYMRVKQVQTTAPQVFDMPVDFYFAGPNDTVTFQIDERSTRLKYHFPVNVSTVHYGSFELGDEDPVEAELDDVHHFAQG